MPQLWQSGLFENLEPYAKGPNGTNLDDFLLGQTQARTSTTSARPPAPLFACPSSAARRFSTTTRRCCRAKGPRCRRRGTSYDAAGKLTVREGTEIKVYDFEVPVDWWFWYATPRGGREACSHRTARRPPSARRAPRRSSSGWTSSTGQDDEGRPARTTMPGKSPTPTFWATPAMIYTSTASSTT